MTMIDKEKYVSYNLLLINKFIIVYTTSLVYLLCSKETEEEK